MSKCGKCVFFKKIDEDPGMGFCHGNPPQALPMQAQSPMGQTSLQVMSFRPQVNDDAIACRHFIMETLSRL